MNTNQAQQKALDDVLVAPADRHEFGKCNMRLKTDIKPKEATFQVVLDALALTPFYRAFLVTADVPAIYMQEFWAAVSVHKSSMRFMKRRKSSKDVKSSRDSRSKEKKSSSTSKDASQSQHKHSGKSAHAEEPSHTVDDSGVKQDQEFDTGNNDEQPADKEVTKDDWFKKPKRPLTHDFDWNKRQHVDSRPPQTWISQVAHHRGRQIIPQNFFINNDLEYLKGGDLSRRYSTSITKRKAATYEIKWIEDLGPKRQHFYEFAANMTSSKDVYSRKRIIAVTRLLIMEKYDYGHLEEIEVRREDHKLYKFREGSDEQKQIDGTLNDVRSALNDIAKGIRMEYLPKRKWSGMKKRSKSENKGKVPTEMELVLEQTQQGTSYEVSVSAEGVEELKRKVKIKGEKKEALLTLRQKPGQYICCRVSRITKMIADIED
ncbi:hypothetical protein Tco_0155656 [Tanacetum coccineum]